MVVADFRKCRVGFDGVVDVVDDDLAAATALVVDDDDINSTTKMSRSDEKRGNIADCIFLC